MNAVERYVHRRFERASRSAEQRVGLAAGVKWAMRYVFPDHWSFLLGEIALYSFLVLVGTGIFLTLYYVPSDGQVIYHGSYPLLQGEQMSEAYRSVLNLSLNVPAGLLFRQVHHWAADVFIASIVLHLTRVFFTGAYRKPRDLNYFIGLTMLMLAILEGFAGYSLGRRPVVGHGPRDRVLGGDVDPVRRRPAGDANLGRPVPGRRLIPDAPGDRARAAHPGRARRADHDPPGDDHAPAPLAVPRAGAARANVVGTPMWPAYALRSIGLMLAVAGVLFLLGGLVQINPIWQWGPYHPYLSENGAQPDWYIGWLIGALRLMPNWELVIAGRTVIPNPFWGGAAFPLFVFGVLFAWPSIERRLTRDARRHDLLDRPRDRPIRTAIGAAFLSWVVIVFAVGSTDRIFYRLGISYTDADPRVARGHLDHPDPRVLPDPERVPLASAKRRSPAEGLAGRGGAPPARRRGRGGS